MELFWYNKSCACDNGRDTAGLCKGSTTDSDSVCEGSNPSPAAKSLEAEMLQGFFFPLSCVSARKAPAKKTKLFYVLVDFFGRNAYSIE